MAMKKSAAEKKAAVLGNNKKKTNLKPILIAGGVLALVLVAGLFSLGSNPKSPTQANRKVAAAGSAETGPGFVSYPVAMFADGQARYFEHAVKDSLKIRYFILKSSDGIIRAAFDACDVCWPANRGYAQEGDFMICRNCGRRFSSVRINEVQGGCNPAPLKRRVEDGKLIIALEDILAGSGYFDFGKRG